MSIYTYTVLSKYDKNKNVEICNVDVNIEIKLINSIDNNKASRSLRKQLVIFLPQRYLKIAQFVRVFLIVYCEIKRRNVW